MSLIHNPSISTNGLLMYYDMNNTMKSWKGAPTTNLVTYPQADWNGSSFALSYDYKGNGVGNATQTFDTSVETPVGDYSGVMKYTTGSAGITTYPDGYKYWAIRINGLTAGVTYTFSYYAKASVSSNFANGQLWRDSGTDYGPSGDWNPTFTTEWKRYSTTRTMVGTYLDYFPIHSGNLTGGGTIYYWGFQMEVGSFATPFVAGTRSSAQALIDLTNKYTLTSSNVTYNSNNTFSFSESASSTITTTLPVDTVLQALSNFTIEAWVKVTAWPTNTYTNGYGINTKYGSIVGGCYYSGTGLRWGGSSSGNSMYVFGFVRGADAYRNTPTYNVPSLNVYNHFVFTNNPTAGSINLYVNGVLSGTAGSATQQYNPSLTPSIGNLAINRADVDGGGTGVYSYINGNIDGVKIYNKALTASEVQQNFNAHRGRYGL